QIWCSSARGRGERGEGLVAAKSLTPALSHRERKITAPPHASCIENIHRSADSVSRPVFIEFLNLITRPSHRENPSRRRENASRHCENAARQSAKSSRQAAK